MDGVGCKELMGQALEQLRSALQLLDEAGSPAEIGAKVDLAIHELYHAIAGHSVGGTIARVDHCTELQ